jgi:hypothetical protein
MTKMRSEIILDGDSKGYIAALEKSKQANAKMKADYEAKIDAMKKKNDGFIAGFKKASVSFAAAGATITAALALVKVGMEATGGGADKLVEITSTLRGGFQEFARAIAELDFTNFIRGIRDAAIASGEWASAQDRVNTRISDFQLLSSKMAGRVAELRSKKAMGIITKDESLELLDMLKKQEVYQKAIYADAIKDVGEYISTKTGLDKKLFDRLEQGIEERAALGDKDLEYIKQQYKDKEQELKRQFKDVTVWMTGPTGLPQKISVASAEFNAAMGQWIGTLSGPELAQLTEDTFLDPAKWNQLVGYYVKRNELTTEYAGLETRAARAGGLAKGAGATTGHGTENIIPGTMTPAGMPSLSQIEKSNQLMTQSTQILYDYNQLAGELSNTFEGLFSAGLQGWDAFGKAALQAIEQIIVKLAALAATYLILSLIPGFAEFMKLAGGFAGFMQQGMGFGNIKTSTTSAVPVAFKIRGPDLVTAGARSSYSLGRLT